jgi:hypothetical protein
MVEVGEVDEAGCEVGEVVEPTRHPHRHSLERMLCLRVGEAAEEGHHQRT